MGTLDDIRPGQTIGRYEFLVPIAKGGMAAVWTARQRGSRGFAKTVAIKTMLPMLSQDMQFEQMFLDEAKLAAQIHHPNVVEVLDLGEENDLLYQVMEFVDGESLSAILRAMSKKKVGIPLDIALRIIIDACRGLHAAHELTAVDGTDVGLVHRDISPQNIMITYDGVVKIVDFGVAKAAGRGTSETSAGQIKGKAPFMAPEQALGEEVDRRTDIFAMGIVLYLLTTGKHPFRGETDIATLHNILTQQPPSPRVIDPNYPRPLEMVVIRALSRDPSQRFSTAKEMADAISRVRPPTVRGAESEDVGAFVQELLGDVGRRRREALIEAIKRADARAESAEFGKPTDSSASLMLPLEEIGASSPSMKIPRAPSASTPPDPAESVHGAEGVVGAEMAAVGEPSSGAFVSAPLLGDLQSVQEPGFDALDLGAIVDELESGPQRGKGKAKLAFFGIFAILGVAGALVIWAVLQPDVSTTVDTETGSEAKDTSSAAGQVKTAEPAVSDESFGQGLDPNSLPKLGRSRPKVDATGKSDGTAQAQGDAGDLVAEEQQKRITIPHKPSTSSSAAQPSTSTSAAPVASTPPVASGTTGSKGSKPAVTHTAATPSAWKPPPVTDPGF